MKKTVTLGPGESKVIGFTYNPGTAKGYSVSVDGLSGSFVAIEAPEADFVVSDLVINPTEVFIGEPVSISVVVTNVGNETGTYEVNLEVL